MKAEFTKPRTELTLLAANLSDRERRYVRLLTQQASDQKALDHFLHYCGFIDSEGQKAVRHSLKYRLARLRELAAMPCDWFDKR